MKYWSKRSTCGTNIIYVVPIDICSTHIYGYYIQVSPYLYFDSTVARSIAKSNSGIISPSEMK